jgi:phosphonopyruvate decarboxylase
VGGSEFVALLERSGFDFFAGVPCSLIEDVIAVLERHPRLPYVDAVREDVAVGLAGGAWLAGRRPAVLMQNSGLGTSLNALASFSLMYRLPALLLVTWRGYQGQDAPEHLLMGRITPSLLEALGIPFRTLSGATTEADVAWARAEMDARMSPVALLLSEGAGFSEGGFAPLPIPPPRIGGAGKAGARTAGPAPGGKSPLVSSEAETAPLGGESPLIPTISRMEAIGVVMKMLGDELVVAANGYPSREACAVADRPQNFYMIGSMGLAAAIGLGLALAQRRRRVVVFDGDGNLLMSLGVLGNVAALGPGHFIHCVFDNEAYGSTGNQRSPAATVRLDRIAAAAGYRSVTAVTTAEDVGIALRTMLTSDGPHFLLVKVTREEAPVPRIAHAPETLRTRFRAAVLAP